MLTTLAQDMRDPNIISQEERSNCYNFKGISLLTIWHQQNICSSYPDLKLAVYIYTIYPEFILSERLTIDIILSTTAPGEIQRTAYALYISFVNLTKAVDLVSRKLTAAYKDEGKFKIFYLQK